MSDAGTLEVDEVGRDALVLEATAAALAAWFRFAAVTAMALSPWRASMRVAVDSAEEPVELGTW